MLQIQRIIQAEHPGKQSGKLSPAQSGVADPGMADPGMADPRALLKLGQKQAGIGFWELQKDGALFLSEGLHVLLSQLSGLRPAGFGLFQLLRLFPTQDYELLKAKVRKAFERGTAFELDVRLLSAQAEDVYARISAEPQADEDTKITRLSGFFMDISELRKTAEQLERESQKYLSIYRHHTSAIFTLDAKGNLVEGNDRLKEVSGYSIDELKGTSFLPLLAPEDIERVHAHFKEALQGRQQSYTACITHKNRQRFVVQLSNIPVFIDGRVEFVYGIASNITEEYYTKQNLKEKVSLLQAIQESSNDSIFALDLEGNYLFFNREHARQVRLLYHKDIKIGDSAVAMMKEGPDWPHVKNYLFRAYEGESLTVEDQFGPPDKRLYFQMFYKPIFTDGKVSGVGIFSRNITEQKHSEEEMRRSQRMYETLFNDNPIPLLVYELDREHLSSVNDAACHLLGYSREELLRTHVFQLVPDEEKERVARLYQEAKDQKFFEIESLKNVRKDGSLIDIRLVAHHIDFEGKEAKLVLLDDITEKKHAEQQREALGRIIDYSVNEVYIFDARNLHFLYVSKSALSNLQYQSEEFLQMTPLDIKPDMDVVTFTEKLQPLLQEGSREIQFETAHQRKDGSTYPVRIQVQNAEYTGHKVFIATVTDITEEKSIAEEMAQSKRFIESIADTSPELLYVYDLQHNRYIYFSNHIEEMLGYKAEDVLSGELQFFSKLHPEDFQKVLDGFQQKMMETADDEVIETEYRVQHRDGHWIWLSSRDKPFKRDKAGTVIQTVGAAQNITRRKEYEHQLEEQNEVLKKTNDELDRFVYSSSHDLRAPLASVLGLVNVALMEESPGEKDNYIRMMEGSIHRLDRFIQDIINYSRNSRLEAGHEVIDFEQLIGDTLADLNYMDGIDAVSFETHLETQQPFASDLQRLSVIFSNLISNAIRYRNRSAEQSYVKISVKTSEEKALIRVEDNGIGIASEYQQKVFDMFFKASHEKHGSGIGLYIVKETTDVLGGSITLESKTRVGTTFTIQVPNRLHAAADQLQK